MAIQRLLANGNRWARIDAFRKAGIPWAIIAMAEGYKTAMSARLSHRAWQLKHL